MVAELRTLRPVARLELGERIIDEPRDPPVPILLLVGAALLVRTRAAIVASRLALMLVRALVVALIRTALIIAQIGAPLIVALIRTALIAWPSLPPRGASLRRSSRRGSLL